MGTADEKPMAVTSKQLINIAGNAEKRKSTEKNPSIHDHGSKRVESSVLTQPRALSGQLEQTSFKLQKLLPCSFSV